MTELFGPFQIVVEYGDKDVPYVLELLNALPNYLTAALVSNDPIFTDNILGDTLNGKRLVPSTHGKIITFDAVDIDT